MRRQLAAGIAGLLVVGGGLAATASAFAGDAVGAGERAGGSDRSASLTSAVAAASPTTPLVLISGRDDHGELASGHVTLYTAPGGQVPAGKASDGTLARVVGVDGTWLRVRTVEGPRAEGWVDDFYLRRELHLVGAAPTCRTTLAGQAREAGAQAVVLDLAGGRARVRLVQGAATGWVPRPAVRELAPREGCGSPTGTHASGHVHHH